MKKLVSLALGLTMLFSFACCGNPETSGSVSSTGSENSSSSSSPADSSGGGCLFS